MKQLTIILLFVSQLCFSQVLTVTNAIGDLGYTSDFSIDTDGWAQFQSPIISNIDGISDGFTSFDNVLKTYASNALGLHIIGRNPFYFVANKNRIRFKFYIPSSNTNVKYIRLTVAGISPVINYCRIYNLSTRENYYGINAINVSGLIIVPEGYWYYIDCVLNNPIAINVGIYSATPSVSFSGAGSINDDIFYVKDFEVYTAETGILIKNDSILIKK